MDASSFFEPDPHLGLLEMLSCAERLLGLDHEDAFLQGDAFRGDVLAQMDPLLRAGVLPPAALTLAAGACAVWGSPKSYALRPYWDFSFALEERGVVAEGFDPAAPLTGKSDRMRAAELADARERLEEAEQLAAERRGTRALASLAHMQLERARFEIARLTGQLVLRPPPIPLVRAAAQAGVLGACDQFWDLWRDERPRLYANEARGPAWRAMRLATDALAGGDAEAAAQLHAMRPGAPGWLAWVIECVDGVMGSPLVAASPDEPALQATAILAASRGMLAPNLDRARAAWSMLGRGRARAKPREPELPRASDELERALDAEEAQVRAETGPFFDLRVDAATADPLMAAAWPLLVGFRQLYGLCLVRGAVPELAAWVSERGVSA